MTTQKPCKNLEGYSTNKGWTVFLFVIAVALILLRTIFALEKQADILAELNKKTVIFVNDVQVVNRQLKRDTVSITITKYVNDTILVKENRVDSLTSK